ncbi:hypothetical protein [Microvirga yunnanensis]|uniref:hypothetical protein n=1 Tax=Microvirga yunnanensis TaxID=2953740 RepID=UPI0021C92B31|nr:hypothetical protein [Microvirga sp. HBU65207]
MGNSTKDSASSIEKVGAVVRLTSFRTGSRRYELANIPDLERALDHPAAVFAQPDDVLRHPFLGSSDAAICSTDRIEALSRTSKPKAIWNA